MKADFGKTKNETIGEWLDLYGDELYRWAFYKVSDKESAEDLVQETFLAAIKSIDSFQGKSNPKTWLFSILNNKIMDWHRVNFRKATVNASQLDAQMDGKDALDTVFDSNGEWLKNNNPLNWHSVEPHLLDNLDFRNILDNCMKNLPDKWYSAVQLKYLEQKSGKIICQELGITQSNFWQILHRSKVQLRNCLEMKWFKN